MKIITKKIVGTQLTMKGWSDDQNATVVANLHQKIQAYLDMKEINLKIFVGLISHTISQIDLCPGRTGG